MKRSEINQIIKESELFMNSKCLHLPTWAYWSIDDWNRRKGSWDEIMENQLGWDITDFGSGDFARRGLVLFTLRNEQVGKTIKNGKAAKTYAEKIMVVQENQETPFHFHWNKMEDIINRNGGLLSFELYKSNENEELSDELLTVSVDGIETEVKPGEKLTIEPGQSLTLEPYVYHRFYAEEGHGPVLTGEVSMVNDDHSDNRFLEPLGRFPEMIEDVTPYRLLVSDYAALMEGT